MKMSTKASRMPRLLLICGLLIAAAAGVDALSRYSIGQYLIGQYSIGMGHSRRPTSEVEPRLIEPLRVTKESVSELGPQRTVSQETFKSLDRYEIVRRKVLPTAEDLRDKELLLGDSGLLMEIDRLLHSPAKSGTIEARQQLVALDLLFSALSEGNKENARAVAKSVVLDESIEGSVEASVISQPEREALAQIKAEVLYRWSAFEPENAEMIQQLLPGPVSRKIWDNVRMAQSQNLAESKAELTNAITK